MESAVPKNTSLHYCGKSIFIKKSICRAPFYILFKYPLLKNWIYTEMYVTFYGVYGVIGFNIKNTAIIHKIQSFKYVLKGKQ